MWQFAVSPAALANAGLGCDLKDVCSMAINAFVV